MPATDIKLHWLIFNLLRSDLSPTPSSAFTICVFLSASGPKLPSWCTRYSTAVRRRTPTCARSPTLPTFQVAEGFALPAATASFNLWFTAPLLAAEHFRLLAPRCGTGCHRRLRRHRLWRPSHSTQDVPVHGIISWHSADLTVCFYTLSIVDLAVL